VHIQITDVPADLDLHWSHRRKKAYIWRKWLIAVILCFIQRLMVTMTDINKAHMTDLQQSLKEILSLWFTVGFLTLERITWKSSCDMLQKVRERFKPELHVYTYSCMCVGNRNMTPLLICPGTRDMYNIIWKV
jgi:hypothetical protein